MSKFLNRLLGMKIKQQQQMMEFFSNIFDVVVKDAKRDGSFDLVSTNFIHALDPSSSF